MNFGAQLETLSYPWIIITKQRKWKMVRADSVISNFGVSYEEEPDRLFTVTITRVNHGTFFVHLVEKYY